MPEMQTSDLSKQITEQEGVLNSKLDNPDFEEKEFLSILEELLSSIPEFQMDGTPKPLSGGLMNYVWRIQGKPGTSPNSLVAKWALPFVASSPDVQLDPNRIFIEAKAMTVFSPGGEMASIATDSVRLPALYAVDHRHHMILMEDVCQCPDLETWLRDLDDFTEGQSLGRLLGDFIGKVHRISAHIPGLKEEFNNSKIQRTRLHVLYGNTLNYARRASLSDAEFLSKRAIDFGKRLQLPGKTLIMGDLWPRSIIVSDNNLRIIDWELAHYGRPAQDIGHFAAHLWMLAHRAKTPVLSQGILSILKAFLGAYKKSLGSDYELIFGSEGIDESSIHFGCEIFARTVGIFQAGYVYDGFSVDDPTIIEAVNVAAAHIRSPLNSTIFSALV